jgi:hypothetical protein
MIPVPDQNERHSHSEVVIIHPDFSSKYSWIIRICGGTPQYVINQAISTRMMVGCLSKIKAHHLNDFEETSTPLTVAISPSQRTQTNPKKEPNKGRALSGACTLTATN